jgi:hypothetical protein
VSNGSRAGVVGEVVEAMPSGLQIRLILVLAAAAFGAPTIAYPQALATPSWHALQHPAGVADVCGNTTFNSAASLALRLVCQQAPFHNTSSSSAVPLIVVGFVGGFVKADDVRHPEPLFASYLRQHYGAGLDARVFSNHDAKHAELYVLQLLDANRDGVLSAEERKDARIIIFGHSWGASETATFARQLGRMGIPVLLTVQLDIIPKPGQRPGVIPANVADAINFYQPQGPLHGRPAIIASDPKVTTILGNVRFVYGHAQVDCRNYNWFARTFNRPHHEIENDAQVWNRVASLIDAEVRNSLAPAVAREAQAVVSQADGNTP